MSPSDAGRDRPNVLAEILAWSQDIPAWQQDCLRRLVVKAKLDQADFVELANICKSKYGLHDPTIAAKPLSSQHLPQRVAHAEGTTLVSLTHRRGVNALAANQTISFGPELTVVYGPNAAGKSGYTRILKSACRARGAERIFGNVFGDSRPVRPSATLVYQVGDITDEYQWSDDGVGNDSLGQISVFDSKCAAVYIRNETDVAFRPFGLDLFDSLSAACENLRRILEKERRELEDQIPDLPTFEEGTSVYRMVRNLTALTDIESLRALAQLTEEEAEELQEKRRRIRDLENDAPEKTAAKINLRASRLEALLHHLERTEALVGEEGPKKIAMFRGHLEATKARVGKLKEEAFADDLLAGSGNDEWKELWEAARLFSEHNAYRGRSFPVTTEDAACVLCQQDLTEEAATRLRQFEAFVKSQAEQQIRKYTKQLQDAREEIRTHITVPEAVANQLAELGIEAQSLAENLKKRLGAASERRTAILDGVITTPEVVIPAEFVERARAEIRKLRERSSAVSAEARPERIEQLKVEVRELESRELLGRSLKLIIGEIRRQQRLNSYLRCIKETNTAAITRKSSELTRETVTNQLADAFKDELNEIGFHAIEIDLRATGGKRGTLYHRLVLRRAPNATLAHIASEGEARAVAVAAFFAELSTASNPSAILFDDPVSSLDHNWRENVACRLLAKARKHQVVVFTHDVVFLMALNGEAGRLGVRCDNQYIRNEPVVGAGVASSEIPWIGMKVKDRLGVLRNKCQAAAKVFRIGTREEYEREAIVLYGLLRETWERALEEVLLDGVIQRYRPSVQTQQIGRLADITNEDCRAVEDGMSKCSRWLPGHDQPGAENVSVPDPTELERDIERLFEWRDEILKRRR